MFIKFNTEKPSFNKKWVWQAVNYALDKDAIIDALFKGKAEILKGQIVSPEYFGYNPRVKHYPYYPEKAAGSF
jgi:peptide/nickel transport system substrate-binding protein